MSESEAEKRICVICHKPEGYEDDRDGNYAEHCNIVDCSGSSCAPPDDPDAYWCREEQPLEWCSGCGDGWCKECMYMKEMTKCESCEEAFCDDCTYKYPVWASCPRCDEGLCLLCLGVGEKYKLRGLTVPLDPGGKQSEGDDDDYRDRKRNKRETKEVKRENNFFILYPTPFFLSTITHTHTHT